MATTSPDAIWTPDSGDDYALTVDLAAMADTVQDAITRHKTYRVGTDAERLAIPGGELFNGLRFWETGAGVEWLYSNGAWEVQDTGWTTSASGIFSMASGWSLSTFRIRRTGAVTAFYVSGERTGGTIAVGPTGDITNTAVGTLSASWRPSAEMVLSSGNAGRVATGFCGADGVVTMAAVGGSSDITNGQGFSLGGVLLR